MSEPPSTQPQADLLDDAAPPPPPPPPPAAAPAPPPPTMRARAPPSSSGGGGGGGYRDDPSAPPRSNKPPMMVSSGSSSYAKTSSALLITSWWSKLSHDRKRLLLIVASAIFSGVGFALIGSAVHARKNPTCLIAPSYESNTSNRAPLGETGSQAAPLGGDAGDAAPTDETPGDAEDETSPGRPVALTGDPLPGGEQTTGSALWQWLQPGQIEGITIPTDVDAPPLQFGTTVRCSGDGNRVVVGRPGVGQAAGEVYVLTRNGDSSPGFTLEQKLTVPPGSYAHRGVEHQGLAISKDGMRVAFTQADDVIVYGMDVETDRFRVMGKNIDASTEDGLAYDHFGMKLDFSWDGKWLAVMGDSRDHGFVRVYRERAIPEGSDETLFDRSQHSFEQVGSDITGDRFGGNIAISAEGSRVAIGTTSSTYSEGGDEGSVAGEDGSAATNNDEDSTPYAGIVRIFDLRDDWEEIGQVLHGASEQEHFGGSVAFSRTGDILAVGSQDGDAGYVRAFKLVAFGASGSWEWEDWGPPIYGESPLQHFGSDIQLNEDGDKLLVGAPGVKDLEGLAPNELSYMYGRVFVYSFDTATGLWSHAGDTAGGFGGTTGDHLGGSVAMSLDGKEIFAGAPLRTIDGTQGVGGVFSYRFDS